MAPDEILQRFHTILDDLNTRLAVLEQSAQHLTTPTLRKALVTMILDHARQCLDLALSEEQPQ
jgi:hypothetical protein